MKKFIYKFKQTEENIYVSGNIGNIRTKKRKEKTVCFKKRSVFHFLLNVMWFFLSSFEFVRNFFNFHSTFNYNTKYIETFQYFRTDQTNFILKNNFRIN